MSSLSLLIKPCSSQCNNSCDYCFYADECENRKTGSYGTMSGAVLEKTVSSAFEYADGSVSFAFQGGEPTLCGVDFFSRVIGLQKEYNRKNVKVYNSIQTNGTLIDDAWAEFLAENDFLVGLSLDGCREAHNRYRHFKDGGGTWDKAVSAAKILARAGVDFNILCVVSGAVAKTPELVYDTLKKYKYIQFIPCIDRMDGKKREYSLPAAKYGEFLHRVFLLYYRDALGGDPVSVRNFDNYIAMLRGGAPESCGMTGRCSCVCTVEADGSVYPCDFYALDRYRLGSVMTDTYADMIGSKTAADFIRSSLYVADECRACRYYPLCRGGCRRDREPFPSLNKYCASYKYFFDRDLEKLTELAFG